MQPNKQAEADQAASGTRNEPKPRGFAAMNPEMHKEIASKGGKATQRLGVGHKFSSEEASAAGRKGGRTIASIPGHMAALGRKGAKARHNPTVGATAHVTVKAATTAYVEQLPAAMTADHKRIVQVALTALLEPALDEPVTNLTPHRLALLGGTLKGRTSPKTGRPLAAATFRRYVLAAQEFYAWCAVRWPRGAEPKPIDARQEALPANEGE